MLLLIVLHLYDALIYFPFWLQRCFSNSIAVTVMELSFTWLPIISPAVEQKIICS
jgi:hypothetical protein